MELDEAMWGPETARLVLNTRSKTKFPTCPVSNCQNLKFPHISYLAEDRAEFHENERNV